jgi:uncharacterized protein
MIPDDLLDPAAYPGPRGEAVELRTTHLSWVFLTPTEAWKIKRPVDYGFVDYSTPERREHFCREEVRLNRRLAPDVYLGVEPLRRDARGLSFVRPGEVVDHAVRMKRLPDEASASALLSAGRLADDDLDRLVDVLAPFYDAAERDASTTPVELFRKSVEENLEQVRPFIGRFLPAKDFDEFQAAHRDLVARHRVRLDERAAAGRMKDGHGDLRLEHVYYLDGGPRVIDAIDFNRRFRVADVALDAAFLAMELEVRGDRRRAEGFMARFARVTNDYDFYPLLDFYLSYRAAVRAKVACFVAADPDTDPDKQRRKAEEARTLFAFARAFLRPRRSAPAMALVGGLIGSGKSTLAAALGRARGWAVVSSDATRKHLAGLGPLEPGPPEIYAPDFTRRVYGELFRRAGQVLESGRGVLLDATFVRQQGREEARAIALRFGVPFFFVELWSPEAVLRERLRDRAASPSVSDAREDLLDSMRASYEPVRDLPAGEYLRLDSTLPIETLLDQAVRAVPGGS